MAWTKEQIKDLVFKIAPEYGVNPYLCLAIIKKESDFKVDAVSQTGDLGLMQINPNAHPAFDRDRAFDPEYNIRYGCQYLKYLIKRYGMTHGIEGVISAYNMGHPSWRNYRTYVVPVIWNLGKAILGLI